MNYHGITHADMLNGTGLRTVLWVSGCPNHCPGCQNPETWDPESGSVFDNEAYKELIGSLADEDIAGLTFCGGSPLAPYNRDTVTEIARVVKEMYPNKTIWCYTGYSYEDLKDLDVMNYLDVLVDGRFIEALKDPRLKWKGSSNQRVILVQESLQNGTIILHPDND